MRTKYLHIRRMHVELNTTWVKTSALRYIITLYSIAGLFFYFFLILLYFNVVFFTFSAIFLHQKKCKTREWNRWTFHRRMRSSIRLLESNYGWSKYHSEGFNKCRLARANIKSKYANSSGHYNASGKSKTGHKINGQNQIL